MEYFIYLICGGFAGLVAGLFGVGGGIIVVPILSMLFTALHFPHDHLMHLAIGTSLATIITNSITSTRGHQARGNIDWGIFKRSLPALIAGAPTGAYLASILHSRGLQLIFATFECLVALKIWLETSPNARTVEAKHINGLGYQAFGGTVGVLSSLLGVGGGTVSIPIMLYLGTPIHRAIGTAAAIGLPVSVMASIGYMVAGWSVPNLPQPSLGFVYLPAFIGITAGSLLTVSHGVALTYKLPIKILKRLLALLLFGIGVKMLWALL
jgi:uncharacterized protein